MASLSEQWDATSFNPLPALWRHRELLTALTKRDIAERYRGAILGIGWAVLNPLVMLVLYTFVFSIVLKVRFGSEGNTTEFALYLFCGMLPWLALSEAVGRAAGVITGSSTLVKKVVFPLEILPVKLVFAALFGQAVGTIILLIAIVALGYPLHATTLLAPLLLVPQVLLTAALCWVVASLGVYLRDMGQAIGLVLTAWMFATPIFYPANVVPERLGWILLINPATILVEAYRDLVLEGTMPPAAPLAVLTASSFIACLIGYAWFYRTRPSFADVL